MKAIKPNVPRIPNDEFYTRREDVETILSAIKPLLPPTTTHIYCPCDGESSEFPKVLSTYYPNVTYTSDDFRNHTDALKSDETVVITNPPFSLFKEFTSLLKSYIIIGPACSIASPYKYLSLHNFIGPDGNQRRAEATVHSSMPLPYLLELDKIHTRLPKNHRTPVIETTEPNGGGKPCPFYSFVDIPDTMEAGTKFLVPLSTLSKWFSIHPQMVPLGITHMYRGDKKTFGRILCEWDPERDGGNPNGTITIPPSPHSKCHSFTGV